MAITRMSPQIISRAMNILASWCQSSGVKVLERNGVSMVVTDAEGMERRVTLAVEGETGPYAVDVKRLTHRNLSTALAAFAELQVALGFEASSPVNRGPVLDRKLSNGEDSDLAAFRHTEFRRVPNPSDEKLASYQWLITQASKEFFSRDQWRCQDHMLDIDDLKSHAAIWTCNFIGLYERADLTQTANDKLLHTYLIQRFNEFRTILINKGRNELPKPDDASIALYGYTRERSDFRHHHDNEGRYQTDPTHWITAPEREKEESCGEDLDEDAKRAIAEGVAHRAAGIGQELSDLLSAMGHDKMVETLTAVVENDRIHPDARREAEKRLERHREEGCSQCPAPESPEVADPVAGGNSLGGEESVVGCVD